MTRSLFLNYTSAVAKMMNGFPDAGGDYDLFYVEFDNQHIKQAYTIRVAALHLHIAARSRTSTVKERLLEQMVELEYCADVEGSLYLAPLDWLFVDQPPFMKAKELGYVEVVREKEPGLCVVRVSPVTLHLAGPFATIRVQTSFEDELFDRILPVRQVPKKPHVCRQQETRSSNVGDGWL
jgi:hypothetical protein